MPSSINTQVVLAGVAILLLAVVIALVWKRRVKSRSIDGRLQSISQAMLRDFLIPDGNSGEIHIEYALLTARGILILDIKDVQGHVFGSDAMRDWTVIDGRGRFTFNNPQNALFDRVAAVKRITPNIPVAGYVAFTNRAQFTKGKPDHVVLFDQLVTELSNEKEDADKVLKAFFPSWDQLQEEAVVTQAGELLKH